MAESVNTVGLQTHTHAKASLSYFFVVAGSLKYHSNTQIISAKGGDTWAACSRLLF